MGKVKIFLTLDNFVILVGASCNNWTSGMINIIILYSRKFPHNEN